jgi:hypothetical protein
MLEQSAQFGVVAAQAGGTLLVPAAELGVLVEQGQNRGQPRPPDLKAPAVQYFPVAGDVAHAGQQFPPGDFVLRQGPD